MAALALAVCSAGTASAQNLPPEVEVLGEVTALFDGEERTWLTFLFPQDGARGAQASASWQGFDTSLIPQQPGLADMGVDLDSLSDDERAYFEQMQAQLAERQAALMVDLAAEVEISITGHDPANPALLIEGVLILSPQGLPATAEEWQAQLGEPVDAAITYVLRSEGGMPARFYTSDAGEAGRIIFETLDFGTPFGMASGRFSGSLCRVEMQGLRITEHPDDCRSIEGRFETELAADAG